MSVNYNPATPTNGLVLCIDPSNPRCYPGSGTTVFDLSGNNNNGTLTNGASVINTSGGRALDFDGVDDFADYSFSQAHNPDYITCSAWVNVTGTGVRRIVAKPRQVGAAQTYSLVISSNGFAEWIAQTATFEGAGSVVSGSTNLTNLGWCHIAGSWNGAVSRLFVNGLLVNSATASGVLTYSPTNNLPLQIGRFDASIGQYFSGRIDDVRIYNRALSESEIRQLFESKRGKYL